MDFTRQKIELVDSLRRKGINDENVLNAFLSVPREKFVDPALKDKAYLDHALPIGKDQTISQPFTVAYMTQLLKISQGDRILEIGTGSGYQCAILYKAGAEVYTIERIEEFHDRSKAIFEDLGYDIKQKLGDGSEGWQEEAPFDGIIFTAALKKVPVKLLKQLKLNGRMVVPLGSRTSQAMNVLIRTEENDYIQRELDQFKFVPMIGKYGW